MMTSQAGEAFFARPRLAVATGTFSLVVVVLMAFLVPAEPLAVDSAWSEAMKDIQTPALKDLALVFNALGRGFGSGLTLGAVGLVLLLGRRWIALIAFAITESLTPLTSWLLKATIDRPRPPDALIHPVGSSFPSGHAAYAGSTTIALVALFTIPGPRRPLWWTAAATATAGMAWSRTYLQVHWLSDVIAGSLLGAGISLVVFGLATTLGRHQSARSLTGRGDHSPSGSIVGGPPSHAMSELKGDLRPSRRLFADSGRDRLHREGLERPLLHEANPLGIQTRQLG